jgi:uncharacterized protein (DUF1697 family)
VSTYVALLRGINVGGRQKLPMADLRGLLEGLGYADVKTHLQSGNALFGTEGGDAGGAEAHAEVIEREIDRALGLSVKVLVRTPAELARVVEANPFPAAAAEPTKVHVAFLSGPPDPARLAELDPARFAPDELRAGEREVYLWYPEGAGRTKLSTAVLERRLGLTGTARNWKTVTKLVELAG